MAAFPCRAEADRHKKPLVVFLPFMCRFSDYERRGANRRESRRKHPRMTDRHGDFLRPHQLKHAYSAIVPYFRHIYQKGYRCSHMPTPVCGINNFKTNTRARESRTAIF